jgi:uncharacterized membrane protein
MAGNGCPKRLRRRVNGIRNIMLEAVDIRTIAEVSVTVASAVAVVVTLKTDIRWLTRIFDAHALQDKENFANIRNEVDRLREQIFSNK